MSSVSPELFRREILAMKDTMYGMALRIGLPSDDAADVVQDTLIALWRGREQLPGTPAERRMYCLRALRNNAVSCVTRRRVHESLDEAMAMKAPPEPDTEYRDTRSRIERLMDELPPPQQETIRLSAFACMDNAEIAEATGRTEANVRQLLSRGRRKLRELIESRFDT